jgi:hypothetical protein
MDINININIFRKRHKIKRLVLEFGRPSRIGETMATAPATVASATMTDAQQLSATIKPEDANGNVVPIPDGDAVVWSSSAPTVVVVTPAVDGLTAACVAQGVVGSATISVVINDAAGHPLASVTGTIQVIPAAIAQVAMSFGTPSAR